MLAKQRDDVFAVVSKEKGWRLHSVSDNRVVSLDLNDKILTDQFFEKFKPKTIFDCVAFGAYSFEEDVQRIYQTNFLSLISRIETLAVQEIATYIHAGSSSEYGANSSEPNENAFCEPNSHYSVSKIAASNYLRFMGKSRGFPCIHLRLYSIYGDLEDSSRLIPQVLSKAMKNDLPPLADKSTSRDFVYVEDACNAFILAAANLTPDICGEAYNIGSGKKTTIGDLVDTVSKEFNVTKKPIFGKMGGRTWDTDDWFANPQKAKKDLGWQATTSLIEGLNKTSKWISDISEEFFEAATKLENKDKRKSLSAIIACYKDEEAIEGMHERLVKTFSKLDIDYEIIFVNDCSPDNAAEKIKEISAKNPKVFGITHSRNFGSQMAFRSGMEMSSKDGVVLLDGDLQDPPEIIEKFYHHWTEGYDVIFGRRIKREMPRHTEFLYKSFYRIFSAFSYIDIPKDAGDFSLIDRKVVNWLLNCPERDLFLRGLRAYVGFKQIGVDYNRPERMFGVTTNNFFKNLDWAKRGIFSFSNVPLTLLTVIGLLLFLSSILLAGLAVIIRLLMPELVPKGLTTLLITCLLFGSLNIFATGLIGEYVAKIMTEVKQRPRLIRSEIIRNGTVIPTDLNDQKTTSEKLV